MSENQKKIWVTGASSGIGRAVAEKFAKEGWKVAVSARREEILNEMSKNENIFSFPLDVTNFDNCKSTFDKILNQFGNIDICFLCSGTYDPKKEHEYKYIRSFSDKLIDKALELEGTITGEHGIGLQKKEYLLKQHADNIPLMKVIKKSFDANNIMNPGKIFD